MGLREPARAAESHAGTTIFSYDPFGRRIQKSGSSWTTNYLYDGMGIKSNVIEEVDNTGNTLARYAGAETLDEPLSELRSATTSYYEQDGLGSVTSLTSSIGALANSYAYDSFGKLSASAGTTTNPFQYTGREFDPETGLLFNRARYFDPTSGRFLSEDPLAFGGGINFYAYAANAPSNLRDPLGLDYSTYKSVLVPVIYVDASITIYGPGATDDLAARWQKVINDAWNKNPGFGKCQVKFEVRVTADPTTTNWHNAAAADNYIYVPIGSPADVGNPIIDKSQRRGTIPSETLPWTVAHEFGHLLHMYDSNIGGWHINPFRPDNDIMNEGDVVSQYDINRVVNGGGGSTCGCQ